MQGNKKCAWEKKMCMGTKNVQGKKILDKVKFIKALCGTLYSVCGLVWLYVAFHSLATPCWSFMALFGLLIYYIFDREQSSKVLKALKEALLFLLLGESFLKE